MLELYIIKGLQEEMEWIISENLTGVIFELDVKLVVDTMKSTVEMLQNLRM